ncbi:cell wall-active antibiotics response protein LiaF [Bacillus songklensis]|uniref:Cell wall-active antibiotics response protein LiaF n=1 Tax=Bacillus songklensis TaxID=1069116 RepID=A0ABV8B2T7_9BACI
MLDKRKTDYISWILLIGILLLLLEISFFNTGIIFSLFISVGFIYIGRKRLPRKSGKILFWLGLIGFFINILSMMTFKFFLLAILVHVVIRFIQTKRHPVYIQPVLREPEYMQGGELLTKKPLFDNRFMGRQQTPEHVYEWNDINIQAGIGDTVIDLSYTVLPKGEAVVFIRNFIGNIRVLVPYEVEMSVHHSVWAGTAKILNEYDSKVFNQVLRFQTSQYEKAEQKVKIMTSMMVGDLEVKRI